MKHQSRKSSQNSYDQLSLRDLLDARDLYHRHLMDRAHVVATAIGRYRIRHEDSWPHDKVQHHGTGKRTMENSEVRPYSWPCVLVLVDEWLDPSDFSSRGCDPSEMVPKTLYLPDGRRVPVCVIEASLEARTQIVAPPVTYPLNNLGGGFPVLIDVQGQEHVATIACLVSDGHKAYALTNRHVTGEAGEVLYSQLGGKRQRIGVTAPKQLTRIPFTELYPGLAGSHVYVNMDIGLIDVDDLNIWTAEVRDIGEVGPMKDLSSENFSLALIGGWVRGYGSTSKVMLGEIQALFYRYKQEGGFEYVSDFLIGPRSHYVNGKRARKEETTPLVTHAGDSGTLWLIEPKSSERTGDTKPGAKPQYVPLAIQWGRHVLNAANSDQPRSYVLATCLSTVCAQLNVDLVRDWNLDQPDVWGAVGHFSIASRVTKALSGSVPKLKQLMTNNALIISHDDNTILTNDFKGMGSAAFVPLADVPDFYWKHGSQGFSRGNEGPNHFADMDQKRHSDNLDLLTLCKQDAKNISAKVWDGFYDSVRDILTGDPIAQKHRGLLPFRVWQLFDEMVKFASAGDTEKFVCAAGVLTHYVGDACQPLHISYLHDGDPEQPVKRVVHHKKTNTDETVTDPKGKGVHSAYEDEMVNANRQKILTGLNSIAKVTNQEIINTGAQAAALTIALMRNTFDRIPPASIVQAYLDHPKKSGRAGVFFTKFGQTTIQCMKDGTHTLAVLWESAWRKGNGNTSLDETLTLTKPRAMEICGDRDFCRSCTINQIGALLQL